MKNSKLCFGLISKIIFFGGTPLVTKLIEHCIGKFELLVITSERFSNEKIDDNYCFLDFLNQRKIPYYIVSEINIFLSLKNMVDSKTLGISVSAPWIFKQKVIDLFSNKFINIHRTFLPADRGCAGISWALMQGKMMGGYTYHLMTKDIDRGEIILQEEVSFPSSFYYPREFYHFLEEKILSKFKEFIVNISKHHIFSLIKQDENKSTYWPRLNSEIHGYIDWSWNCKDIVNFTRAFSEPFSGVKTFINSDKLVYIKKMEEENFYEHFHPFQSGLIYKKNKNGIYIAAIGGGIRISELYYSEKEKIDLSSIKLGDRLYTPNSYLMNAKLTRVFYKADGSIVPTKNITFTGNNYVEQ